MTKNTSQHSTWNSALRVLTFRSTAEELNNLRTSDLYLGILFTWLAGMGRYWDNPRAGIAQHLGVGSLVYILVLAGFLWLFLCPISRTKLNYKRMLTFVSMTSLPAILYAIPVERFMEMEAAQQANAWFLTIVAAWRVALLFWFMRRGLDIKWALTLVAGLLPITLIIVGLTMLNLEHVVFDLMGGMSPEWSSQNDMAYGILFLLTYISMLAFFPLTIVYLAALVHLRKERASSE